MIHLCECSFRYVLCWSGKDKTNFCITIVKVCFYCKEIRVRMITLNFVFCIIRWISIIIWTKSENVCLDNSVLTCYCQDDMSFVSCNGKTPTSDSFIDWAPFASAKHRQHSFTFYNLTLLTHATFTNFSSTFHLHGESIDLIFINGMDEIGENAFQPPKEYSDSSITITFISS